MRIGVNLLPFRKHLGGVGRYAKSILNEIKNIKKEHEYVLFLSKNGMQNFVDLLSDFEYHIVNINSNNFIIRVLFEQLIFPLSLRANKIDALFTPSVAIPILYNQKMYTTVHDLAYKHNKTKYNAVRRKYISWVTKAAIKKSDLIFTVSNFTKKEILKEFNTIEPEKILVTYNGVDNFFINEIDNKSLDHFKTKYKLPDKFISYVGAIEPGKNLNNLIKGFSEVVKHYNDIYLVMTCGLGWSKNKIYRDIEKYHIQNKIIFLPYIPDEELPKLYQTSLIFVYISTYEGFGLPVLEAMASATPVITSNSEAIKEFINDSVISLNSNNAGELRDAILRLLEDEEKRKLMSQNARVRAMEFMWSNPATVIHQAIIRA